MMRKLLKAFNTAAEGLRSPVELAALYAWWPWGAHHTPQGKGEPVLVLPGLTGSDAMTAPLRQCLAEKGYDVHGWDGGINTGFNDNTAAHLVARLRDVHAQSGGKKVILIGHSLGGIFARELARDFPDLVDRVITLGTPFGMQEQHMPKMLAQFYKIINPSGDMTELTDHDLHLRRLTPPPGVPVTSIYSQADGIVPWRACLNPRTPLTENIAVQSSHLGMIFHPQTVSAVLDRMAAPREGWKPFDPAAYPAFAVHKTTPANENDLPANPHWTAGKTSRQLFRKK